MPATHALAVLINSNKEVLLTQSNTYPTLPCHPDAISLNFEHSPAMFTLPAHLADSVAPPIDCVWVSSRQAFATLPAALRDHLARALQATYFFQNMRFCHRCGSAELTHHVQPIYMHCTACQYDHYPAARPAVIVAIRKGEYILLAKAVRTPPAEFYSAIAGFVEIGESFEHALMRETREEVGVSISNIRYITSQAWPFGASVMVGYIADYESGDIVLQASEIAEAAFFHYTKLPVMPPASTIARQLINQLCAEIASDVAKQTP